MRKIVDHWNQFWFTPISLLNLAVFRIILCSTIFLMNLGKFKDLALFYSSSGIVPRALAQEMIPEYYRPLFVWFVWPDSAVFWVHAAMLLGLLALALGVGGRILTLLVWMIHISFLQRNYAIAFGADLIGGIFLLYMAGTQSCARLSILKGKAVVQDVFTPAFYRLIQIQLCVIYAYTGMEKLKGGTWWDGTALWSVFANSQMVVANMIWMKNFPLVIAAATFFTIVFEVYFPVLVWVKSFRRKALFVGMCFHTGIALVMALFSFAAVMMAPYVLFLDENDLSFLRRFKKS